ncbi:hypothetical protein H4S06_000173 [Coemansia sp. BCRC 34490]|nr:hypothetical protein H4S06_000173 [Coemansia sp. BCRC 34490]
MHSTRKQEAMEMVEDYIFRGIEGILDLAIPDNKEAMKTASELGSSISALIESLLLEYIGDVSGGNGDDDSRVDIYLNQVPVAQYTIGTLATNPGSAERQGPMLKDAFALVEVKTGG